MLKPNDNLIINRGLVLPLNCNDQSIIIDQNNFINSIIATGGQLPVNPPFETNPYKNEFPLENFEKYIIGTFPPISYILDNPQINAAGIINLFQPIGAGGNVITQPWIPFYHGNRGSMWDFLLTAPEMNNLMNVNGRINRKHFLINFLIEQRINYSDIIDTTQRNLNNQGRYDGKDKNLNNICPNNNLNEHVLLNPNAKYILFNTSSIFGAGGVNIGANGFINVNNNIKSFDLFIRQYQEIGIDVYIRIQQGNPANYFHWTNINNLNHLQNTNKIIFELKLKNPENNKNKISDKFNPGSEKILTVVTGPSPSAIAQLGLIGNTICDSWLLANPQNNRLDFISWVYQNFRNNMFAPLYLYNN